MGFEKPKSISSIKVTGSIITAADDLIGEPTSVMSGRTTANYSIGELLSFLPKSIKVNDLVFKLCIHSNIVSWIVEYADISFGTQARLYKEELIDALFAELVILKEEGVI